MQSDLIWGQYSNKLMEKSWDFSLRFWLNHSVRLQGDHQCVNVRFFTQHVVQDVAETHMTNCFCNSQAIFMTNEARLKINLSQMRDNMWSYKGLDQGTNNTSGASIKLSCHFFMTSWTEFKKKDNRPYLIVAKISNRTYLWMSSERWKHSGCRRSKVFPSTWKKYCRRADKLTTVSWL